MRCNLNLKKTRKTRKYLLKFKPRRYLLAYWISCSFEEVIFLIEIRCREKLPELPFENVVNLLVLPICNMDINRNRKFNSFTVTWIRLLEIQYHSAMKFQFYLVVYSILDLYWFPKRWVIALYWKYLPTVRYLFDIFNLKSFWKGIAGFR